MESNGASRRLRMLTGAAAVWLALAAIQASIALGLGSGRIAWWIVIALHVVHAGLWTVLTFGIGWLSRAVRERHPAVRIAAHVGAGIVVALVDSVVRRAGTQLLIGGEMVSFARTTLYYADLTTLSYLLALWLAKALDAREALAAQSRHELALRSQLARARLSYLHAQLQPHFLFNALGAVSELIFESPAAAIRTFKQLRMVLKAAASRDTAEIPLRDEVEGLLPYLEVQRTRFSDWLAIELDIDAAAGSVLVPPLLLQPLVENSIRHGLRDRSSRGVVTIAARIIDERLLLSVRDNGAGIDAERVVRRSGVGLSNTEARLRTLYGEAGHLRLFNDELGGAVAEVAIPARTELPKSIEVVEAGPTVPAVDGGSFARRHPVAAILGGAVLGGLLWSQQSYTYLVLSGRLGERTLLGLVRDDFVLVLAWTAMVPIIAVIARRIPVAGSRWPLAAALHMVAAGALTTLHAWVVVLYRAGPDGPTLLQSFRSSVPITLLLYLGVLAYSQRRLLEDWVRERQLAALALSAEITEANIAAATMSVSEHALDSTLEALERHAHDDPLRAEQAVAQLGSDLRQRLERAFATTGDSGDGGPPSGEDRVERLAMGA